MTTTKNKYRIYWHKNLKKWMVNISYKGQNLHIGYFTNLEDAVIARNEALAKFGKSTKKCNKLSKYQELCEEPEGMSEGDKKLLDLVDEKDITDII